MKKHIFKRSLAGMMAISTMCAAMPAFTPAAVQTMAGDVNLDSTVSVVDIVALQGYLLGRNALTQDASDNADVAADGAVNGFDLAVLKRMVTKGTITEPEQPVDPTGDNVVTAIAYEASSVTLYNAGGEVVTAPTNVTASGTTVTVILPSVIDVSGTCDTAQIVVDVDKTTYADGVVELALKGVNLSNSSTSPIYVAQIGDEVEISVKNGYDNTISDGTSYTNADGDMGAIYACDDLKIKGKGNLTVNGNGGDAIVCKNDIKLYNGNITVNAVDDGIRGKDSVTIGDADDTDFSALNVTVNAAGDGVKSTETDTTSGKGYITINGGTVNITAGSDAIHASQALTVNGGDITVKTTGSSTSTSDASAKGLKAGSTDDAGTAITGTINVNGGYITADTTDDSIHASGNVTLVGGKMEINSGDDAVHSDADVIIGQGTANTYDDVQIIVYSGYEGIEGLNINMNSGTVITNTTDDGFNAAGGADGSGSGGNWGGGWNPGGSAGGGNYSLNMNGGFTIVNTANGDHDGFDSNGSLTIAGGIHVSNGQEPFDCDGTLSQTGGVYVKNAGSGGMGGGMMPGGSGSLTESVSVSASVNANTRVTLCDGSGNVIVSFITDKNVSSLIAGCPSYSGAAFYTGGELSGSTYFQEIDQTQLAAYGGTLSGGTAVSGSSSGNQWW